MHQQPRREGKVGVKAPGVVHRAAGNDQAHRSTLPGPCIAELRRCPPTASIESPAPMITRVATFVLDNSIHARLATSTRSRPSPRAGRPDSSPRGGSTAVRSVCATSMPTRVSVRLISSCAFGSASARRGWPRGARAGSALGELQRLSSPFGTALTFTSGDRISGGTRLSPRTSPDHARHSPVPGRARAGSA